VDQVFELLLSLLCSGVVAPGVEDKGGEISDLSRIETDGLRVGSPVGQALFEVFDLSVFITWN